MLASIHYKLPKVKMLRLLEELKANSIEVGSLCVPPHRSQNQIESLLAHILESEKAPEDLAKLIASSPTGAILFWGAHHRYLVMPPFPVLQERAVNVCEIEPLHSLLNTEIKFGLVLVRLGAYGLGVVKGETLLSSKVGTGLVHARHRQGGSSAHRFERHRDKQMETFFTRVCTHAREQLEPFVGQLEYMIYGGTRETLLDFRKQCHFLHQFDSKTLDLLLDVREPNQAGLREGIQEAWSSRVVRWDEK
ncbi:MAG TPA: Vms1/Ankzf1 family peptidyl-tRNA hydrolase [Dehalococcoidales bacterium]|jgi:peptide subunit release factor 1 (eRF1)